MRFYVHMTPVIPSKYTVAYRRFTFRISPGWRTVAISVIRSWLIWLTWRRPLIPPMSTKAPYGFMLWTDPTTTDPIPNCPWLPATALRWLRTSLDCSSSTSTNLKGISCSRSSSPVDFWENRQSESVWVSSWNCNF